MSHRSGLVLHIVPVALAGLALAQAPVLGQGCKSTLVSVGSGGSPSGNAWGGALSDDGRFVMYSFLESGFPTFEHHVWLRDEWSGVTARLDVDDAGVPGDDDAGPGDLSADGRFAVFESRALNLVPGKTVRVVDVLVRDTLLGTTTPISLAAGGQPGNGDSWRPRLSADGLVVAFHSGATNLVPGDTNGVDDLFVFDLVAGVMSRISVGAGGVQANDASWTCDLSADGRYVAFSSAASNLAPNDTNGDWDVFVHDRVAGTTTLISRTPAGASATGQSWISSISTDGRYVVFESMAADLVPGDSNGVWDVFRHDRLAGTTQRISVDGQGNQLAEESFGGPQSADGSRVQITSLSAALAPGDSNAAHDAFVLDLTTGAYERSSVGSTGVGGPVGSASFGRGMTPDARYVSFESDAGFPEPGKLAGLYLRGCPQTVARYGEAKPNSAGCRPWIAWSGVPSASAGVGFVLRVEGEINNVIGVFAYSDQPQTPSVLPYLWLKPPAKRVVLGFSGGATSGHDCSGAHAIDFNAWIAQSADPQLVAGATVYGQFWSRDTGLAPPNAYGMSEAVDLTIGP